MEASCSALRVGEACVALANQLDSAADLWLYALSADCVACPYSRIARLRPPSETVQIEAAATEQLAWRIMRSGDAEHVSANLTDGLHCELSPSLTEFGSYRLTVAAAGCRLDTLLQPANPYIPLAVASGLLLLSLLGLSLLFGRRDEQPAQERRRVRALDTVRGMSILLMIFVNGGAGGYPLLEHATWDGLRLGDLVFPCFVWIMGVCIPLSVSSQLSRGASRLAVCRGVARRSLCLCLLGICLNSLGGATQLGSVRLMGVLQRFGLSYLVAASVYACCCRPKSAVPRGLLRDVSALLVQWLVALLLLALHALLIFLLPVPNCPSGYLGPGGRHLDGAHFNCSGGATGYVDRLVLGVDHLYQRPAIDLVYGSGPFDPEGLLGCLTTAVQVFLGVQAGQTLREFPDWRSRLARWLIWALGCAALGAGLHLSGLAPVNKSLWSVSFVLVSSSFCLGLLSACYLLIDVARLWRGGPFRVPGMNALLMYAGHQVLYAALPFHWRVGAMSSHGWLLAECLWCVGLWVCVAYALHARRIYLAL